MERKADFRTHLAPFRPAVQPAARRRLGRRAVGGGNNALYFHKDLWKIAVGGGTGRGLPEMRLAMPDASMTPFEAA
jgi:hypothetical protein